MEGEYGGGGGLCRRQIIHTRTILMCLKGREGLSFLSTPTCSPCIFKKNGVSDSCPSASKSQNDPIANAYAMSDTLLCTHEGLPQISQNVLTNRDGFTHDSWRRFSRSMWILGRIF